MKFKYLLIAVLAGAALVGCNKEKEGENGNSAASGDTKYMAFSITMPQTKAATTGAPGSYQAGTTYENQIKSIHFYFYHSGSYVSWGYGDVASKFPDGQSSNPASGATEEMRFGVGGSATGVVVLESTMIKPDQVLCIINAPNPNIFRAKKLKEALALLQNTEGTVAGVSGVSGTMGTNTAVNAVRSFYTVADNEPYFLMVSSPVFGANNEVEYATKIDPNVNICTTVEEAREHPVTVNVERVCAQVELTNFDSMQESGLVKKNHFDRVMFKDGDENKNPLWDIKPIAWSLTAVNSQSYTIKNASFDWKNSTTFSSWVNGGDRINWAIDPNMTLTTNREYYPHSAREIASTNQLHYYSAQEVETIHNTADYLTSPTNTAYMTKFQQRYCYENTFDQAGQNDPRIPGTMLLLYAQAKPYGASNYEDLYYYAGEYLKADEYADHLLNNAQYNATIHVRTAANTFRSISRAKGDAELVAVNVAKIEDVFKPGDYDAKYAGYLVDLEKKMTVPADFPAYNNSEAVSKYADGYMTLIPNPAKSLDLWMVVDHTAPGYDPTGEEIMGEKHYKPATTEVLAQAFLKDVLTPTNKYAEGRMYYAIPIEHFGKAFHKENPGTPQEETILEEGNYGVVRNNFYKVSVDKIKTMGHGIADVDEPIVPGDRKEMFYIAAKINILSWQTVTQTANLEE